MRLALIATLVAVCGGGSRLVDARAWTNIEPAQHLRTVEAATLMASLPLGLTPPVAPGLRVVAMIASDIDADGDLDLVANDGSLDLIVWINDGTGHLTRRESRHTGGWRGDASTANADRDQATVSAVVSASVSVGPDQSPALALAGNGELGAGYVQPSLDSLASHSQSPRAPPLPRRFL